jgi:hypothetical protein
MTIRIAKAKDWTDRQGRRFQELEIRFEEGHLSSFNPVPNEQFKVMRKDDPETQLAMIRFNVISYVSYLQKGYEQAPMTIVVSCKEDVRSFIGCELRNL